MKLSRRNFVLSGVAGMAAASAFGNTQAARAEGSANTTRLAQEIVHLYQQLPGKTTLKIWAPPIHSRPAFLAEFEPDTVLFCGSAFKAYVLAEFLRQMECGETRLDELLTVNDRVWSLSSSVLTPWPGAVTGQITARTALDAMIAKSDNTATDMMLARVGADRIRQFLADQSLTHSRIPDSTRQFFGYVIGSPEWRNLTWKQLLDLSKHSTFPQRPLINDVQTMAASANDFVSFYTRALQGEFFQSSDTLTLFRSILAPFLNPFPGSCRWASMPS
jgi:beta-lactamase class A